MTEALTHGAGQDLLAAWKRAWERRDVDAFLALFTDDAEMRLDPFLEPLTGANAIRAHWNAFADVHRHTELDAEHIWISDRTVLASWHGATTDRRDAQRVRHRGFLTFELTGDGRIQRLRGWPVTRVVGTDSTLTPEPDAAPAGEGT